MSWQGGLPTIENLLHRQPSPAVGLLQCRTLPQPRQTSGGAWAGYMHDVASQEHVAELCISCIWGRPGPGCLLLHNPQGHPGLYVSATPAPASASTAQQRPHREQPVAPQVVGGLSFARQSCGPSGRVRVPPSRPSKKSRMSSRPCMRHRVNTKASSPAAHTQPGRGLTD